LIFHELKKTRPILALVGLAFVGTLALISFYTYSSRSSSGHIYQKRRFLMGTLVTISVVSDGRERAFSAMDRAFHTLQKIESQTSRRIAASFTNRINEAAGRAMVSVSSSYLALIQQSVEYFRMTEGSFDITVGPLTTLWQFEDGQGRLPDDEEISRNMFLVNCRNLQVDEIHQTIGLKKVGALIDLGGIAKGFAVDQAVSVLKEEGMPGGMVNAGGDIRLFGLKPSQERWRIGIQHPRQLNAILASLKLTDTSIVTSGDYERYFFKDGIRYHHILDPKSGQPARGCQSVTIVSETALSGDALSTGVFILGLERGMALIEDLEGVEGLIVDQQGKVHVSSGLQSFIRWGEDTD
jgi:thiamine biosynthesis lipoprotein